MNDGAKVLVGPRRWDGAGMTASFLCVVHCVVSPFLAMVLPVVAAAEGTTHGVLALAVLSFALLAFVPGFKKHGRTGVLALGTVGTVLIWSSLLLPDSSSNETLETILTVSGGVIMVVAHLWNVHLCKACSVCSAGPVNDALNPCGKAGVDA